MTKDLYLQVLSGKESLEDYLKLPTNCHSGIKMKKVVILDTSIASTNLGDQIIVDSVYKELKRIFPSAFFVNSVTHDRVGKSTFSLVRSSNYTFVGGTNLLSSNMWSYNQWKISLYDSLYLKDILLMGVGWWQYQKNPSLYTKILLRKVLNKSLLHSVRDAYTLKKLNAIGLKNVINTGCPTTWDLTPSCCEQIPQEKSESVVFTLTDYKKDFNADLKFINILGENYKELYFWPQGLGDIEYLKSMNVNGVKALAPSLSTFDSLLRTHCSIDYVGTRLHAGIRALQYKKRSIILAVDNRATEKQKDTNLPVIPRANEESISRLIKSSWPTQIKINQDAIEVWRAQF